MTNTMEQWRDIPGWNGVYQTSNKGRVKSVDRTMPHRKSRTAHHSEKILSPEIRMRKYAGKADARVSLCRNGKRERWLVSRLIAFTWCTGYAEGMTVNHINGDTLDNRPENLEWVTLRRNVQMAYETGMTNHDKPVVLIDEDGNSLQFCSRTQAAKHLGVTTVCVCHHVKTGTPTKSAISGRTYYVKE